MSVGIILVPTLSGMWWGFKEKIVYKLLRTMPGVQKVLHKVRNDILLDESPGEVTSTLSLGFLLYRKGCCENELRWWMVDTEHRDWHVRGATWKLRGSLLYKACLLPVSRCCLCGTEWDRIHGHTLPGKWGASQTAISSQRAWPSWSGRGQFRTSRGTDQAPQRDELWKDSSFGSPNPWFISKQATKMAPLT